MDRSGPESQLHEQALREAKAHTERQRRLYEAILANTPDLAYVFNLEHRFIYANEGLLKMWGRTWDDAIGKNCLELGYEPWHAAMHDREIERVIATRQPVRGEVPFTGTNGTRIYDYIFVPVVGPDGKVEAVAGTTRDVTEYREAQKQKDHFIATLAHELRNPLAPLQNGLMLLEQSGDSNLQAEVREMMKRQLGQLVHLIDDLLDVSRVTQGKVQLQRRPVELREAVRQALEACRPFIGQRSVDVVLPDEPVHAYADPTRLVQILNNLVNNACKFTEQTGRLEVSAKREGQDVLVWVRDDGIGIPPDMLERIFELFAQLDTERTRAGGGLGIGLALVKQLVQLHGGEIRAFSEGVGQGAQFLVRLPAAHAPAAETAAPGAQEVARRRVLVVDDNRDAAHSLLQLLKVSGSEAEVAYDGFEGLAKARAFQPEIILLDIGMPRMDGYETCRAIRMEPWGSRVTVVALTGWGQETDRRRSAEAGFDAHFVKPADWRDIARLLQSTPTQRM